MKEKAKHSKTEKNKKKVRGATRDKQPSDSTHNIKWGRVCLIALLLGVSGLGLSKVNWQNFGDKMVSSANRPLAHVKIEGEFRFVSKEELKTLISPKLEGSFVDLDLRVVKHSLEENPWIESVNIERIWPDSIKLQINEHKPIARWNDDGYINHEGELIKVQSNQILSNLPLLSGEEEQSVELAKNYVLFSDVLEKSQLKISGLYVDKKMSWKVEFENAFALVLGRTSIQERLENFQYVYDAYLNERKAKIEGVDMRYESGLAVKWKKDPEFVAANTTK